MDFFQKNRNILIFFSVLVILIYGISLWGDFVLDDRSVVSFYEILKNPLHIQQIFSLPYWTVEAGLYRPVVIYTYSLNYFLNYIFSSTSPFSFHLVNLILYILTCFYIFKFLNKLFGNRNYAILTATIFLILPIHSEAIANIIGRAEILALLFSVLFLNELLKEKVNYFLLFLFLFLGLGSKETAIAVIPIAIIVFYIKNQKFNFKENWKKYIYHTIAINFALFLYFLLRFLVLGQSHFLGVETSIIENQLLFATPTSRFLTALSILTMYVSKIFVPLHLCSDYSYNQIQTISSPDLQSIIGFLILISLVFSIFYFIKKRPAISLGSAIFVLAFLPVSNLFLPIGTIAGERLMFFPSLGIAMILAYFLIKIWHWLSMSRVAFDTNVKYQKTLKNIFIIFLICVFIFYIFIGINRSITLLSEKRLFINARQCAPHSVLSISNMGTVYYFEGRYAEAEKEFLQSIAINDTYSKGLNNLGLVYWKMGQIEKAKEFYFKAINNKFPYPGAYENMALLYLSTGDTETAKIWLEILYQNDPAKVEEYLKSYGK